MQHKLERQRSAPTLLDRHTSSKSGDPSAGDKFINLEEWELVLETADSGNGYNITGFYDNQVLNKIEASSNGEQKIMTVNSAYRFSHQLYN